MSNEWRFPAPFERQPYNPDGLFNNPAQTLPLPTPTAPPVGVWIGAREPLTWIDNGAGEYVATWGTPIFDLRPALRGLVERSQNPAAQGATPVWVASGIGAGGRLYVQINDLLSNVGVSQVAGVEVYAQEFCAIADVGTLDSVTPNTNITLNIIGGSSFESIGVLLNRPLALHSFISSVVYSCGKARTVTNVCNAHSCSSSRSADT